MKVKTKAEAAKRLAQINERFAQLSSNHNCRRLIPTLLCLDDSVSNLMKDVLKNHRLNNDFEYLPELYLSYMEFLLQWHYAIDEILDAVIRNGFDDPTTKIKLPSLTFGIYTENLPQQDLRAGYLQFIADGQREGKIPKDSRPLLEREADFLPDEGNATGYYCLFVNSDVSKKTIRDLGLIFTLRDLYVQKSWLGAMIYKFPAGVEAEFRDEGLGPTKIFYPKGFDHADKRYKNGLSTRFLDTNFGVFDWNSNLRELSKRHLKNDLPKGTENLADLKEEWQEINSGLSKINGFPETFLEMYKMPLEVFTGVIVELLTMCYNRNGHMVGTWSLSDLFYSKLLIEKFSSKYIRQVIDTLSSDRKTKRIKTPFIIPFGNLIFTNFRRLQEAYVSFPQVCFDEACEEGLKGPVFEGACRNILRERGFNTVPNCVKINEPMLPKDVSIKLWLREKPNTDLDVVASNRNCIILLECKEIKSLSLREGQVNQFRKYIEEMFWRAKWVSSNPERFKNYVGEAWASLHIDPKQPITIVPLIVSNNLVEVEEPGYPPVITSNELFDLLSMEILAKPSKELSSHNFRVGTKDISLIYMMANTTEYSSYA